MLIPYQLGINNSQLIKINIEKYAILHTGITQIFI